MLTPKIFRQTSHYVFMTVVKQVTPDRALFEVPLPLLGKSTDAQSWMQYQRQKFAIEDKSHLAESFKSSTSDKGLCPNFINCDSCKSPQSNSRAKWVPWVAALTMLVHDSSPMEFTNWGKWIYSQEQMCLLQTSHDSALSVWRHSRNPTWQYLHIVCASW